MKKNYLGIFTFIFILVSCENNYFVPYQEFQITNKSDASITSVGIMAFKDSNHEKKLNSIEELKSIQKGESNNLKYDFSGNKLRGSIYLVPYAVKSNGEIISLKEKNPGFYFSQASGHPYKIPYEIINNQMILNDSLNNVLHLQAWEKYN